MFPYARQGRFVKKKQMNLLNKKILVTGGASGIGLELTKSLVALNCKVLICGRSIDRLDEVKAQFPSLVETFQCDLAEENQCQLLVQWIYQEHSDLSVLFNNAAIVHNEPFLDGNKGIEKARKEMAINFFAPMYLIKQLYPILTKNESPAIVNITTGLVYTPRASYSYYNSTKAALHSFTQVLRMQIASSNLKVIEVMMPVVNTVWHKGKIPKIAISAEEAVALLFSALVKNKSEIRLGKVKLLYWLTRIAPAYALRKINSLQTN